MRIHGLILFLFAAGLPAAAGMAQVSPPAQGMPVGKIQIDSQQARMLDAARTAMTGDLKGAEAIYSAIIATNASHAEAYFQRGLLRRELKNPAGAQADGKMAAALANQALQSDRNNARLYYQRGMGFRLAGNYEQAEKDVTTAIRLGGQSGWQTDLKAIQFERKAPR